MLHHKRSPGVQAPARVRGRCAGLGSAPARPGSARCAGEQVWLIPCCKLLANREFKLAAPSQHRRQPGRGGAGSCRGNPANLGAGCSPPPHALSGKPCPAATGLARVRQPRRIKQIVPARASASSAQITHSGALFTDGPKSRSRCITMPLCVKRVCRGFWWRVRWSSGSGELAGIGSVVPGPGVAWPKSRCLGCEPAALATESFPCCPPGLFNVGWLRPGGRRPGAGRRWRR
jgi:hypothetical protein